MKSKFRALDIIKGLLAWMAGGAMLIGGIAVVIFKFVKSEHGYGLVHGATAITRIENETGTVAEPWWQACLHLVGGIVVLGILAISVHMIERWYARRCLLAGDKNAKRGDHQSAILKYDMAIKKSPKYALAYHNRGLAEVALGRLEKAQEDFTRAHDLDSSLPLLNS